jgi:hypothetical protein
MNEPSSESTPGATSRALSGKQKLIRSLILYFLVTVCAAAAGAIVGSFVVALASEKGPGYCDFIAYWAAGHQLAHQANPYDGAALLALEQSAGMPSRFGVLYTRNPPWVLPLIYPLGFLSARIAFFAWNLMLVLSIWGSVRLLLIVYGRPATQRVLLGYFFGPALLCLITGQLSLFALLGLALFLWLHRTRPFMAGASLWLCALKPHLFIAYFLVLLAWIVVTRSYLILLGTTVALAASCAAAYWIDPHAWTQYALMVQISNFKIDIIPCIGFLLRYWIKGHAIWLQYVLTALGSIWALAYYWKRRAEWDWRQHGNLVLLVSLLTAPYIWIFDQAIALPALLEGIFRAPSRNWLAGLALMSALIELAHYSGHWSAAAPYYLTLWAAPAWLVWYLLAKSAARKLNTAAESRSSCE